MRVLDGRYLADRFVVCFVWLSVYEYNRSCLVCVFCTYLCFIVVVVV